MKTLTIYTKTFDKHENVRNEGFSDSAFIDDQYNPEESIAFYSNDSEDNLRDALNMLVKESIEIDHICFCYYDEDEKCQKFKRFEVVHEEE